MNWRLWGTAFREFSAKPRYVDYAETASLQPARTHALRIREGSNFLPALAQIAPAERFTVLTK